MNIARRQKEGAAASAVKAIVTARDRL